MKTYNKARYFVMVNHDNTWKLTKSQCDPQPEECQNFFGPFRTKRGALFMATEGVGNPLCTSVNDAEILSKVKWKEADVVMAEVLYGLLMGGI